MSTLRQHVAEPRAALQLSIWEKGERIRAEFEAHRKAYPAVYNRLRELARDAKARGFKRIGIAMLYEVVRWEYGPHSPDRFGFGLNQDLRAYYARALMAENEELAGMFETRCLRSEQ